MIEFDVASYKQLSDPDDTLSWQRAFAAVASLGSQGGLVRPPPGTCDVSAELQLPDYCVVDGDSQYATTVRTSSPRDNVFSLRGIGQTVRDINIVPSVPRLGPVNSLDPTTCNGIYVGPTAVQTQLLRYSMFEMFYGVTQDASSTVIHDHPRIYHTVPDVGISIRLLSNTGAVITRAICDAPTGQAPWSHLLINHTEETILTNCDFIRAKYAVYINPAAGQHVLGLRAANTWLDTSQITGLMVTPGPGGIVGQMDWVQCWMASAVGGQGGGVDIVGTPGSAIDGITFDRCMLYNNHIFGVRAVNARSINVTGCEMSAIPVALYYENVVRGRIQGNDFGPTTGKTPCTVGISLAGGTANLNICGNIANACAVPFSLGGTAGHVITGNSGF